MTNHSASWRMPTEKQMEKLAADTVRGEVEGGAPLSAHGSVDDMPETDWEAAVRDPHGVTCTTVPVQDRRLSEIPRRVLRVWCRRCGRTIEIKTADAIRLYGRHEVWKNVGRRLLDSGCSERAGSHEDDGCWPAYGDR
jgi:hypothetical protein